LDSAPSKNEDHTRRRTRYQAASPPASAAPQRRIAPGAIAASNGPSRPQHPVPGVRCALSCPPPATHSPRVRFYRGCYAEKDPRFTVRDRSFLIVAALAFTAILAAYSDHFTNAFHFDDFHTITSNPYVHSLGNLPRFFRDAHTFSILPEHGSYRPLVSASVALDYSLAHG